MVKKPSETFEFFSSRVLIGLLGCVGGSWPVLSSHGFEKSDWPSFVSPATRKRYLEKFLKSRKRTRRFFTWQLFLALGKNSAFLLLQKQFWKLNRRRGICAWSASSAECILSRRPSATTKRRSNLTKFSLLHENWSKLRIKRDFWKVPFRLSGALILGLRDFGS